MRAVQLEAGRVVVEAGRLPGGDAVAVLAGVREAAVAGVPRASEVALMTGEALRGRPGVARAMARGAGGRAMRAVQLETGGVVVEGRRLPGGDAVAVLAGVREAAVTGIAGAGEITLMAREAVAGRAGVPGAVAARALGGAVGAVQLEAGGVVIEERRLPGGDAVAFATGVRKAGVHGIAGAGEVGLMTGEAFGRSPGVARAVAGRALDGAVGAEQLEAGLVVIEGRRLPGRDAVAVLASVGEAGVHGVAGTGEVVLMAGEALGWCGGVAVAVTGDTVDRTMSAVQLESGPVVIESRRLPGRNAVAGLARGGEPRVARAGRAPERRLMAGEAVGLRLGRGEVERRVAALAGSARMRAGEIEAGRRVLPRQR